MNFSDKSFYDRIFQQVTHKGGESAMNYIKRFQIDHALSFSVGKKYSEDQLMHIFEQNIFHLGENYPEIYALIDPLSIFFLLKMTKHGQFGIF